MAYVYSRKQALSNYAANPTAKDRESLSKTASRKTTTKKNNSSSSSSNTSSTSSNTSSNEEKNYTSTEDYPTSNLDSITPTATTDMTQESVARQTRKINERSMTKASDFVSNQFTPDYALMPTTKKTYDNMGNVVGVEDAGTQMSYATQPTPKQEFMQKEQQRYKEALVVGLSGSVQEYYTKKQRYQSLDRQRIYEGKTFTKAEQEEYDKLEQQFNPSLYNKNQEARVLVETKKQTYSSALSGVFLQGLRNTSPISKGFELLATGKTTGDLNPFSQTYYYKGKENLGLNVVYNVGSVGGYVFDIYVASKGASGLQALKTSQVASNLARSGINPIWKFNYNIAQIGRAGGIINTGAKLVASTGQSLVLGRIGFEVTKRAYNLRRNIGLNTDDMPDFQKEYEDFLSNKAGLVGGIVTANTLSEAYGKVFVISDTVRKGRILTYGERALNVGVSGYAEGSTIVYLGQESVNDERNLFTDRQRLKIFGFNTPFKTTRAEEMALGGLLGAGSASTIDKWIEKARRTGQYTKSKFIQGVAYTTDTGEYVGDLLEETLRGGQAFKSNVKINTFVNARTFTTSSTKTRNNVNINPNTMFDQNMGNMPTKTQPFSVVETPTSNIALNERSVMRTSIKVPSNINTNIMTNTNTLTTTPVNTFITTNTNTKQNLITRTNTDLAINTNINENINTKISTNINENVNTNINENVNEFVNVFVPTGTLPVFLKFQNYKDSGFGTKKAKIFQKQYQPSLLGIELGERATRTKGLSGFEVRGLPTTQKPRRVKKKPISRVSKKKPKKRKEESIAVSFFKNAAKQRL